MRRFTSQTGAALLATVAVLGTATGANAASATAQYRVRFDATWSATTHPLNFPASAHLSPLIGGTHDAGVQFWAPGGLASPGIRDMAELGRTTPLDTEVQAAIGAAHAGAIIRGGGVAPSPGTVSATFGVTQQFSRATVVSMIAPSPDWFAGVNGFELLVDGEWLDRVVVPLFAYDAGTDSGTNYTSANQVTSPAQLIALSGAAPFQNGAPVGLFTFTRIDAPNPSAVPASGPWALALLGVMVMGWGGVVLLRRRAGQAASPVFPG